MIENQFLASDPNSSVWVSANAGTGKTKVLTDRVLRLLLAGTPPSRILCITYTKAAAAEMQSRIHAELSRWVSMPAQALSETLGDLTGQAPSPKMLTLARTLFAYVVDDAEGVRIYTIHAFCQSLLQRFPLEAGTPPNFTVIDDRTSAELIQEAKLRLFAQTAQQDTALAAAIHALSGALSEHGFTGLVREIIQNRRHIVDMLSRENGPERLKHDIWQMLNIPPGINNENLFTQHFTYTVAEEAKLAEAAGLLEQAGEAETELAQSIRKWLVCKEYSALADYKLAFLTQKGEPRKALGQRDFRKKHPEAEALLRQEQQRVVAYEDSCRALQTATITIHIITVAESLLALYGHLKRSRGFLDYDDLILYAHALLRRQHMAPWILYKLDGGIDHILIDEAQDTSALQWDIMQTLVDEFFSGEGSRKVKRTLFVVGDEKQSIFSFQGAEPKEFVHMRQLFAGKINHAGQEFRPISLGLSFRSTEPILQAVDKVFAKPEMKAGLGFPDSEILHEARRMGHAGKVEIWPVVTAAAKEEKTPWRIPDAYRTADKPAYKLANHIADTIAEWLQQKTLLLSRGRSISPGDIMILVQRRNYLVPYLLKALKRRNVPVAGIDRLLLTEHIAVMDLMALGHFLLLPEDDLNLAVILKSPLIGLTEDELFHLAYGRGEVSLWQRLRESGHKEAYEYLANLLARTDYMPVYEFYAHVLEALGGRKKFIARLGEECNDPIDEFINFTIEYERAHAASLQGFLHWLVMEESEVKRDMEQGGDEVRIMTVHGAKGLQAPIVFLPDTTGLPTQKEKLLWDEEGKAFFWSSRQEESPTLCRRLRDNRRIESEQEYRRLLYVAMTRAEDELYICGWCNKGEPSEQCWYNLIKDNLTPIAEQTDIPGLTDKGWKLVSAQLHAVAPKLLQEKSRHKDTVPEYLYSTPRSEPVLARPLTPTGITEEAALLTSPVSEHILFNRGILIHRLLQYLPELPSEIRHSRGLLYLKKQSPQLDEEAAAQLVHEVLVIMTDKEFAPLFGPGSVAEAPISGVLEVDGVTRTVSGQVDRLLVTAEEVWIIDYKTHRQPPATHTEIPHPYMQQMRAYHDLLQDIYPHHRIHCALLWTAGPVLMKLPEFAAPAPLDYAAG